jgi:hypothetical protein
LDKDLNWRVRDYLQHTIVTRRWGRETEVTGPWGERHIIVICSMHITSNPKSLKDENDTFEEVFTGRLRITAAFTGLSEFV